MSTAFWSEPMVWEFGETVGQARAIIRRSKNVWCHVPNGRARPHGLNSLHFSKGAVLDALKYKNKDEPLPIKLYIHPPDMAGGAWLGELREGNNV